MGCSRVSKCLEMACGPSLTCGSRDDFVLREYGGLDPGLACRCPRGSLLRPVLARGYAESSCAVRERVALAACGFPVARRPQSIESYSQ